MEPITREELEKIKKDAKAAGKDVSDIEKLLEQKEMPKPPMGEVKVTGVTRDVWMRMEEKKVRRLK